MNAWTFLRDFKFCPASTEGRHIIASNSEKRRWLQNKLAVFGLHGQNIYCYIIVYFAVRPAIYNYDV